MHNHELYNGQFLTINMYIVAKFLFKLIGDELLLQNFFIIYLFWLAIELKYSFYVSSKHKFMLWVMSLI